MVNLDVLPTFDKFIKYSVSFLRFETAHWIRGGFKCTINGQTLDSFKALYV
jgi:hypothetical protein